MLKSDIIKIKTKGCRKLSYYESLNYDISGEFILIKISDLTPGSREKIDAICDFCNNEVNITYKEYLRNISIGGKYACSKKCGSLKARESNLIKIGVEYPMQLKEYQEKAKGTNVKKYGVEYLMQSNEMIKKSKETCMKKWGVDHISKTEYFKSKFKETCKEKLGVDYPMQSNDVKERSKQTCMARLGVDNPSKSNEIRDKVKKTNIYLFGNENYLLTDDFKDKSKRTTIKKWGVDNPMKSDEYRKGKFSITRDSRYIKYKSNGISSMICENGHEFDINVDNYLKRKESNINICTICNPIGDIKSIKEKELYEFIRNSYIGEIIQSYRDSMEIDIYLPDLKVGFEFNGLYWHSEIYKDKWYHLNKTKYFQERGIRIIHIWEDDWVQKGEIVKSQILNILNKSERIWARKCHVKQLDTSTEFLNTNHIQGVDKSIVKLGLFNGDNLISVMTFNKSEGRKRMSDGEWNLSRFCNKLGTTVVGGASKLLSHFIKEYTPKRIVSYADGDWSIGGIYYSLGFINISESKPDYKYVLNGTRKHKSNFRKSNLKTNLTESEFMKSNEYYKVWDCGKLKFELILDKI